MKEIFKAGDRKEHRFVVKDGDLARFEAGIVHEVCSTFALAREIEWTTRQFVLDLKDEDEEGIGIFLQIYHKAPAFAGEEITFVGVFESLRGGELSCSFEAHASGRLIAHGKTGQKILKREKIKSIFGHG